MSSQYQGSMTQSQGPKQRDTTGIAGLEGRLDMCEQTVQNIFENLYHLKNKLYPPTPTPVESGARSTSDAMPASLENGLNHLINRLQEMQKLSSELLHG